MSESSDLVSIIIPCYNTEQFVAETIESALAQTYSNIEVIVVDDGSTDGSYKILKQYQEHIKIIRQKNSGVSVARNIGILESKGKYIMFVDSDDILSPETVESKIKILESDENIGLVIGDFSILYLPRDPLETWGSEKIVKTKNQFDFVISNTLNKLDPIYRKDVFKKAGLFDPFMLVAEDYDLMIRVAAKFKIGFDFNRYSYYRLFEGTSLSKNTTRIYHYINQVFTKNSILSSNPVKYFILTQNKIKYDAYKALKENIAKNKFLSLFIILKITIKHPLFLFQAILSATEILYIKMFPKNKFRINDSRTSKTTPKISI